MYRIVRNVAFRFDAERVHGAAIRAYRLPIPRRKRRPGQPQKLMGLDFPNVVGLAAGYDKDARAWRGLAALGFGHIEVGTVTPQPQPGNPRPRIFRLRAERALINRMGFPSEGANAVAARLGGRRPERLILGVSIGPNGFGEPEKAALDYELLVDRFASLADYLAINVSSPNTPGLRTLEAAADLRVLLRRIVDRRDQQVSATGEPTPLLVKLSPDIDPADLADTVESINSSGIDGIIVTNTTRSRPGVSPTESGGLSGAPLASLSLATLKQVRERTSLPLIASGGVMTAADAQQRLAAGASLVQVYTGFVYKGPALVSSIGQLSAPGK